MGEIKRPQDFRRINNYIKQNGLTELVEVKGPKFGDSKYEEYRNADLFVFPTYHHVECFPLVLIEAMQFGLPIITTSTGAIPEIIENEINGLIVKKKDVSDLVDKIELIIKNRGQRAQIGVQARKDYFKKYSLDIFEKSMAKVFSELN